jgi:pyruvate/2-oxoglutarate dehydrogenase complex dihydrolipoamide dehydrogenase (E3) component
MDEQTDVLVIGMGPGGEDAAGRLAEAGLHVTGWKPGWSAANAPTGAACRRR